MPSVAEHQLRWYEVYNLHGTCPRCGAFGLSLKDNIWIPPHQALKAPSKQWRILEGRGRLSSHNSPDCPVGEHTQAVEDGGVEAELRWLDLTMAAVLADRRENPCHHSAWEEEIACERCAQFRNFMSAHQTCWSDLARRWSRENKSPLASCHDMTPGILLWRDRKPLILRNHTITAHAQLEDEVRIAQHGSAPRDYALRNLQNILRNFTVAPGCKQDAFRLMRMRKAGLVRKLEDRKPCKKYQITPLGIFMVAKYLRGWTFVLDLVNKHRQTHKDFDPCLNPHLTR